MTRVNGHLNSSNREGRTHRASTESKTPPLHRLGEVRRQEGISLRTVARRLGIDVAAVKLQECESTDVPLSVVYQWQEVLNVPVVELLMEPNGSLSTPLAKRARLVRVMKTALSILEQSEQAPVGRMAQTLIAQLVEMMPELREVGSWHAVGQRRRSDEYGRAAEHSLPDEMFMDYQP